MYKYIKYLVIAPQKLKKKKKVTTNIKLNIFPLLSSGALRSHRLHTSLYLCNMIKSQHSALQILFSRRRKHCPNIQGIFKGSDVFVGGSVCRCNQYEQPTSSASNTLPSPRLHNLLLQPPNSQTLHPIQIIIMRTINQHKIKMIFMIITCKCTKLIRIETLLRINRYFVCCLATIWLMLETSAHNKKALSLSLW